MTRLTSLGLPPSLSRRQSTQTRLDPTLTGPEAQTLEENLRRLIVGQEEAIEQIVNIYQMHLTGLNPPGRPIGNFLFLGPTGTGKTRIVEATAESLLGSPRAVVKIDCGEFQHSHEIAKLIGSPPGYLGHRETHPLLSQEMLEQHHTDRVKMSFVLFDEIEKASDSLWNLLLGILDKATLTLGDNRKVDFSRCMVFLTSNLGATEMAALLQPRLGFGIRSGDSQKPTVADLKLTEKLARSGVEAARRKFTPEFMNRLDKVVVFRPLGEEEIRQVLEIELTQVQRRIFRSTGDRAFVFECSEEAKAFLLERGMDAKYGARHLKRAIERMLIQPLSNLIATQQIRFGDRVEVTVHEDRLVFVREAEAMSALAMAQFSELRFADHLTAAQAAVEFGAMRAQPSRQPRV